MSRRGNYQTKQETPAPAGSTATIGTEPCCGNCPFWRALGSGLGHCRRHPPTVAVRKPTDHGPAMHYPVQPADELCGEHPAFTPR